MEGGFVGSRGSVVVLYGDCCMTTLCFMQVVPEGFVGEVPWDAFSVMLEAGMTRLESFSTSTSFCPQCGVVRRSL